MSDNPHHEHLIKELEAELKPILSKSSQAIYVYLDDEHKFCNQKFADLAGYASIEEWVKNEFPVDDVDDSDKDKVIGAYGEAVEHFTASVVDAKINRKDGESIQVQIIMSPFTYKDEVFVIHFITEK